MDCEVTDRVMLKLTHQILKRFRRGEIQCDLVPKYDGSFEVFKIVDKVAYRLKLPKKVKLHSTFYVSFLKPYNHLVIHGRMKSKRAPNFQKEFDKEAEKILAQRVEGQNKKNRQTYYLVVSFLKSEVTWGKDTTL